MTGLLVFLILLVLGGVVLLAAPAVAGDAGALPELNRHLTASLAGARAALGVDGGAACLAQDQKRWEMEVHAPCGSNADCLCHVTLERLAALDGLQPGASRIPRPAALPSASAGSSIG